MGEMRQRKVKELTEVAEPRFTTTPVAALCSFSSGSLPSPCHFIFLLGLKLNWNCTLLLLSFQILCSDCIEHRRPRCFVLKQLLRSECTWLGGWEYLPQSERPASLTGGGRSRKLAAFQRGFEKTTHTHTHTHTHTQKQGGEGHSLPQFHLVLLPFPFCFASCLFRNVFRR